MERSGHSSMASFFTALAKVQKVLRGAKKDSTNPHFKNRYADLESVWDAWVEVGPDHGFAVMQGIEDAGEGRSGVIIATQLCHCDGHFIESRTFIPAPKGDAQGYGSAITYGRRYALAAMVGIVQTDDDGEAARSATDRNEKAVQAKKQEIDKLFSAKDVDSIRSMITDSVVQSDKRLLGYVDAILKKLESK